MSHATTSVFRSHKYRILDPYSMQGAGTARLALIMIAEQYTRSTSLTNATHYEIMNNSCDRSHNFATTLA